MIVTLLEGSRVARKTHRCWHCYRPIVPGQRYGFGTFKYDDVYTLKYHQDCRDAAWAHYQDISYDDYGEGFPPLLDDIQNGDGQIEIDALRGRFPHVACRLEFRDQIRWTVR